MPARGDNQKLAEHKFIYLDANGNIIDSRIALI